MVSLSFSVIYLITCIVICFVIGGNSSTVASQLTNVVKVFATEEAFAALTSSGRVITWGNMQLGGNSSLVRDQLASDVVTISGIENFNVDQRITPYPSNAPSFLPSGTLHFLMRNDLNVLFVTQPFPPVRHRCSPQSPRQCRHKLQPNSKNQNLMPANHRKGYHRVHWSLQL